MMTPEEADLLMEEAPRHREYACQLTKLAPTSPTRPKENPWGITYETEFGKHLVESWEMPDGTIYGEW